jgi:protein PhnA
VIFIPAAGALPPGAGLAAEGIRVDGFPGCCFVKNHYYVAKYFDGKFRKREIMSDLPNCPKCNSEYTYEVGALLVCPECAHEWSSSAPVPEEARVWKDANGNLLHDGDTVTVIKDLKVRGASSVLKGGTKVKNIHLIDGDHDIDCRIDGFGPMQLKSEYVRKA